MKAYVASVGFEKVGDHWNESLLDLAVGASLKALDGVKATPQQVIVGNMFSSAGARQEHLGALLAGSLGLKRTPAYKVESACASGSTAFNVAYTMVKSGAIDSALVVGVEKMRDIEPEEVSLALAMAESAEYTQFVGASFAALNGLLARYYMEQESVSRDELSSLPVLSHANAVTAEHAQFRKAITTEVVARSAMVADPLRLFDCAPVGDGAAAALVVNENATGRAKSGLVEVLGGSISTTEFSVYKRGRATTDAKEGRFDLDGDIPINTFGGLKARGHPVGATGVYQIAEAYLQLTDQAGKNQVDGARYAATQNIGGVDTTSAVHIFGRAA